MTTNDVETYQCSHCGHEFEHEAGESVQCPKCSYESGVFPMSMVHDAGPSPKKRKRLGKLPIARATLFWVGVPLVAILVLLTQTRSCSKANTEAEKPEASSQATAEDAIATLAATLAPKGTIQELHKGLYDLSQQAFITRVEPGSAPHLPQTPTDLADALTKKKNVQINGFESGLLLGDLARALSIEGEYGEATNVRHAISDVTRKEIGFLVGKGSKAQFYNPWTGKVTDSKTARTLTVFQVAALGDGIASLHLLEIPEVEKARTRVESARKTLPEDPSLLLVEGQVALASGKMAEGIELLARAARTGKDAHSHYVLGMAYMIDESYFKAFQEFQEATRKETDFGEAWLAMSAVELQRMETTPQNQHEALLTRVEANLKQAAKVDANLDGLAFAYAQVALLRGDEEGATEILTEAVKNHPNRPDPAILLAQLALQTNDFERAQKLLSKAALQSPEREDVRSLLSVTCQSTHDWEPCANALRRAYESIPEDNLIRMELAYALQEIGESEKGIQMLEEQITKFPKDATGFLLLSQVYLSNGKAEKALEVADKSLGLSQSLESHVLKLMALFRLDRKKEALAVVSSYGTHDENAHMIMAQALLEQGALEEAEEILLSFVRHKPKSIEGPLMLSMVYLATDRPEEAAEVKESLMQRVSEEDRQEIENEYDKQLLQIEALVGESKME